MSISRLLAAAAVLALVLALGPIAPAPAAPRDPEVGCYACVVVDDDRSILWGRRARVELPNASTTKMTTAILAARTLGARAVVRVSSAAASVGGGGLDLSTGEVYTAEALLYALLLDSSNEAAAALAEAAAPSQSAFVRRMNAFVARLGLRGTRFVNPHGLDASGHHSTALDLATIGRRVLATPRLATIVGTARATIESPGGPVALTNRNPLLETYRGAIGIKTGQTAGAGHVLVAAAERRGRVIVAVSMRSSDAGSDARALLDYGFSRPAPEPSPTVAPTPTPIPSPSPSPTLEPLQREPVGTLVFDPAGAVQVVAASPLEIPDGVDVTISFEPSEQLVLPLEPGERIGTVVVNGADGPLSSVDALASTRVAPKRPSFLARALAGLVRVGATVVGGITA